MSKNWHCQGQFNSRKESEKNLSASSVAFVSSREFTHLPQPESRVKTGRPAQGQRGGTGRRHRYLSGPAGCIWPAARPGALAARRPSCALLSAASGAPPSPAAPQGPRGPRETQAAPGRRQPAPPSARTSTRRYSWLRRAKRSRCERKGGAAACSRGGSGRTGYRKRGLSPKPRSLRLARRGASTRARQAQTGARWAQGARPGAHRLSFG